MNQENTPVRLSEIDEERFGVRTAKASGITVEDFSLVLDFCTENNVSLLVARCLTTELDCVHMMEEEGFLLMDTLVYYSCALDRNSIPVDRGKVPVRPLEEGEEDTIKKVASDSFRGYLGHYHADGKLADAKCDEAYSDWAYRSCVYREVADEVLVADLDGEIVGFATLRLNSSEEGEGVLFGVASSAQGRGIYRSFMINGMRWCLSKDRNKMIVSTQVTNLAVQKSWIRLGFEPFQSSYTFHKWFE